MLTPTLETSADLLLKLERECYRAFHASHPTHTADHLYNFCVTALAVRDWAFVQLSWGPAEKQQFQSEWRSNPLLDACRDIANSSKHCALEKGSSRHSAVVAKTTVVDYYEDRDGDMHKVINPNHPDISVTLSSGNVVGVYKITQEVLQFWRRFFRQHKINIPSQDFATLSGSTR